MRLLPCSAEQLLHWMPGQLLHCWDEQLLHCCHKPPHLLPCRDKRLLDEVVAELSPFGRPRPETSLRMDNVTQAARLKLIG